MKAILFQSRKHFPKDNPSEEAICDYIKNHKLYYDGISISTLSKQIRDQLKRWNQQNNQVKRKLQQLSLYLNNDKNKFMFEIYEIVLKNPKGVTYKDIDKKVSIGIVSVSHYCCRLKKMNFVGLRHERNEKVVYPKKESGNKKLDQEDEERSTKQISPKGFHFFELSAMDNIWINISSWQAKQKNGITNQDIKQKLHKSSETKLIMKMVDQAFQIYDFDKQMVSEGKVFQNRFKNITQEISQISSTDIKGLMIEQNSNNLLSNNSLLYENEQKLNPLILKWLQQKFPNHPNEKFLFHLINEEMRDYISACGVKSAKRTCTPIKLTRYIKILNSLDNSWPQTHLDLKNYIIQQEKLIQNGTMHKRSILGILDCLVSKQILKKQQHEIEYFTVKNGQMQAERNTKTQVYYYPLWPASGAENLIIRKEDDYENFSQKNKKKQKRILTSLNSENRKFGKITIRQHQVQLSADLIYQILKQVYISRLKKGFKRIMYSKRSKQPIRNYEPDSHLLHFLQNENYKQLPTIRSNSYSSFVNELDRLIDSEGTKQQQIDVNYEVIKMFRRSWSLSESELKLKFGNSWYQRIEALVKSNIIYSTLEGNWVLQTQNRFFV